MTLKRAWPLLTPGARAWLASHPDEAVPLDIIGELTRAGVGATSRLWWSDRNRPDGFFLSEEEAAWLRAVAEEDGEPGPVELVD